MDQAIHNGGHGAAQSCLIVNDAKLGDSSGGVALWIGPGTEGILLASRSTLLNSSESDRRSVYTGYSKLPGTSGTSIQLNSSGNTVRPNSAPRKFQEDLLSVLSACGLCLVQPPAIEPVEGAYNPVVGVPFQE
jgi:hypothetical protein